MKLHRLPSVHRRSRERDLFLQAVALAWTAYWLLAFGEMLMQVIEVPFGRPHRPQVEALVGRIPWGDHDEGRAATALLLLLGALGSLGLLLAWAGQGLRRARAMNFLRPSLANAAAFGLAGATEALAGIATGAQADIVVLVAVSLATMAATRTPRPPTSPLPARPSMGRAA